MSALAFALSYAGFTALALAMERPHRMIWRRSPSLRTTVMLRTAGFALLGCAVGPSMAGLEGSTGIVAWCGFLTAAALLLVFLLPYVPRVAVGLAVLAPIAASFASLLLA